jgi:hypothetical protein
VEVLVYQPDPQLYPAPVLSHNVLMAARAVERSLFGLPAEEPMESDRQPKRSKPQPQWLPEELGEHPPLEGLRLEYPKEG